MPNSSSPAPGFRYLLSTVPNPLYALKITMTVSAILRKTFKLPGPDRRVLGGRRQRTVLLRVAPPLRYARAVCVIQQLHLYDRVLVPQDRNRVRRPQDDAQAHLVCQLD